MPMPDSTTAASKRLSDVTMAMDDKLPECPIYHPLSALHEKSGYYPNVNPMQLSAAKEVLQLILSENLYFNTDEEWEFLKILRFLRARNFQVKETMELIRADIIWREAKGLRENDLRQSPTTILACDISLAYKYFPTWVQGIDKQSRPVSWRKLGQLDIKSLLKLTTMQRLIDLHTWDVEQLLRMTYDQCEVTGRNIETFTVVIDVSGWTVGQASRDAYTFIKGIVAVDSDHYPERLGSVIIINAPAMLSWAWRIVQGFLNDSQKSKIRIYGCDAEEWQTVLFETIGEDQIPAAYGGSLPNMTLRDALDTLEPIDYDDSGMQILCGLPQERKRKEKKKMAKKEVDPGFPPGEQLETINFEPAPSKPAWTRLLMCSPPQCDGGDDNADYFIPIIDEEDGMGDSIRPFDGKNFEENKEEKDSDFVNSDEWDQGSIATRTAPNKTLDEIMEPEVSARGPEKATRAGNGKLMSAAAKAKELKAAPVASTKCKSCSVM